MICAEQNAPNPRVSMNFFGRSLRFGILSTGSGAKTSCWRAAMYGPSSRMMASYGGLAFAATSLDTVSTASEATRLTEALLVARRYAGMRMERCASSHAPGYVVAESAPPCPNVMPTPEMRPAAPRAVKPLSASRRVMPSSMVEPPGLGSDARCDYHAVPAALTSAAQSSYKEIETASDYARRRSRPRWHHPSLRPHRGRGWREPPRRARRDRGPPRAERLRQDDALAHRGGAAAAKRRTRRGGRRHRRRVASERTRRRDRLPELRAVSPHDRGSERGVRPPCAWHAAEGHRGDREADARARAHGRVRAPAAPPA